MAELRRIVSQVEEATLASRNASHLLHRQAALEETIHRRARHVRGLETAGPDAPPGVNELAAALGERVLLELIELEGNLYGVVIEGRRPRLYNLATVDEVASELQALRFALRRLARGHGSAASLEAAERSATYAAARLDDLLTRPLRAQLLERPLVIAPTGALHALPWAALPSLAGRPLTVTPAAAFWHGAQGKGAQGAVAVMPRAPAPGRTVLVAGPGLADAVQEVDALALHYPGAKLLRHKQATVERTTAALDGADLAHIAAHGSFRADNPLFSFLKLADGRLTVYDLQTLERAPTTLVLSACESGLSSVSPGNELMGLASALFALGTRTLIASVVPVPDAATRTLMLTVHRWLRAGQTPSVALAKAQAGTTSQGIASMAAAAGFVCFGAD